MRSFEDMQQKDQQLLRSCWRFTKAINWDCYSKQFRFEEALQLKFE